MCTTLELLNSLETFDILKKLQKKNVIVPKVIFYREVCLKVDAEMKVNGGNKTQAVKTTADVFDIAAGTVWEALKKMAE